MSYRPSMYQQSIFTIPYQKLKKRGIKCLVFDLDNTLAFVDQEKCPEESKKLLEKLKKDFIVVILSNNFPKRLLPYTEELEVDGTSLALKPFTRGLRKIKKQYHLKKCEMAMIGDQLMTDIKAGNTFKILTILVDPLGTKEAPTTGINRFFEKIVKKKIQFEKGRYYE